MTSSTNRNNTFQSRGIRHAHRILGAGAGPPDILQTIDQMLGEGSIQILQQLTPHDGGGTETFRIEVPAGTILHHGRRLLGSSSRTERVPRPQHHRQGREFDPLLTLQRWAEEMKILHGDFVGDRVGKLVNHVALALLPASLEALKQAKLQAEEEALRKAEEKAKAEEVLAAQENVEPSSDSTTSTTQPNQTTDTPVEPPNSTSLPGPDEVQPDTMMADTVPVLADAEMADASEISRASPQVNAEAEAPLPVVETPIQSSSDPSANVPERVTVMIHGSAVDITDTGIDPTFLEALPDDMREEVLNQHVRDQQAARVERPPDSQISSEFLDALPPEIRAEIIQQEALERSRRRPEESAARAPASGEPADIDPASFIASLDPRLRQAVLMDQDDGFIQTLPSHMIAEAGVYRDEVQARRPPASRNPTRAVPAGTPARKYAVQHDAILLLDRTGITVLVRLLFFPQVLKKALLFKVLVNLCENAKTRTELFNILLSILQDGTGDLAAVDKSFAQMSVRNRDSKPPLTPKAMGKQKATADYFTTLALPASQIETVPDLIAQRCLEALTYIVSNNQLSSVFFLTEHDLPIGLRRAAIKKGKGKEKQVSQSHYPLVLLLNLLDRQNLLRTPAILESVVNLLATITRPLSTLKEDHKVVAPSGSASTALPSEKPDSVPVNTTTNAELEALPPTQQPEQTVEQGTGNCLYQISMQLMTQTS
jgi:E3 ubiquitin-protein ligase HUWE1